MLARPLGAHAPTPLWHLVEASLDEAEFLWKRWEQAFSSHSQDLQSLAVWIEERLLGSLEGVRVGAGKAQQELLVPALDDGVDPIRATVAAHLLATEADPNAFEALARALRAATPERLTIFRRALELAGSELLLARLDRELGSLNPRLGAALLDARSFQGREPGGAVAQALGSREPELLAAGLRALRFGASPSGMNAVVSACRSPDPGVRDAALESGLIVAAPEAWALCLELAAQPTPQPRARLLLGLLAPEPRHALLYDALMLETTRREALFALGFTGTRAAAEAAVVAMRDPALAQLAAEAFCAITGLDLEAEGLLAPDADGAPEEPIPFEQEDLDADLVPGPDELLPRPDAEGVASWWRAHAGGFRSGERYLRGRPLQLATLHDALRREPLRRRHAIALDLAVRSHGQLQLQTRTFTHEQERQLHGFSALGGGPGARSPLSASFSRA